MPSSTPKDWSNGVAGATPITATSLEDMETRLAGPFINVEWFGATGDGTTDDTAAIQAAIDSISAGIVYFPPGSYKCLAQLLLPAKVSLHGSGREGCVLNFASGLTAGQYAVEKSSGGGAYNNNFIAHLDIRGPGYGTPMVPGVALSDVNGVKLGRRTALYECSIRGFLRGVAIQEDHCYLDLCTITNNHYNIAWIASGGRDGDQMLSRLDLNGCTMASVYCEDGARITDGEWIEVHLGNGPYGILSAPGRVSTGFIVNMVMRGVGAELFGVAFIRGQNTTDLISGSEIIGNHSQSNAYIPSPDVYNYVVVAGTISNTTFEGIYPANPPALSWVHATAAGTSMAAVHLRKVPQSGGFSSAIAGRPLVSSAGVVGGATWSTYYGSGVFRKANAALSNGQVTKVTSGNNCDLYGTADTVAPAGIARHACASGDCVALATNGDSGGAMVATGAISAGGFIKPSTTTAGRVMAATSGDLNVLGVSHNTVADGATISGGDIRLTAWGN